MRSRHRIVLWVASVLLVGGQSTTHQSASPTLVLRATYDTGLGANGAAIISVRRSDAVAVITHVAGIVDVLDLSDPHQPRQILRVPVPTTIKSVAVHPFHDYFLAVSGTSGSVGSVTAYALFDGSLLASAETGIQPDSVVISPTGLHAVVANEAEGTGPGANGGEGSLSIVHLWRFNGAIGGELAVTPVALPTLEGLAGASSGRADSIACLPIDNTPETLEPENIAFASSGLHAYITMQENNTVARLNLLTGQLRFFGLGQTTHAADLTNDGVYLPMQTLTAFREPDGIALDVFGRFFVTTDEGDTLGQPCNAGPRGGRTVSVFDAASGTRLGDTGTQLDDAAATAGLYPDSRSPVGGSEPEGLDLTLWGGKLLVAAALERANAVALIDVSDPRRPQVIDIERTGARPEGIEFFRIGFRLFLATSNETPGTVSIVEVVL